jgi:hypothetical protein
MDVKLPTAECTRLNLSGISHATLKATAGTAGSTHAAGRKLQGPDERGFAVLVNRVKRRTRRTARQGGSTVLQTCSVPRGANARALCG